MNELRVLDLFSGIGGFSLGLERTGGFKTVAFCEIEEFPRRVLAKHWPGVPIHHDVRELKAEHVGPVDVICGGFPCQDISSAGFKVGIEGERSGLWSDYARLVGELRPAYAIVENVADLLARGFDAVLSDMAALGYDAEWHCIPASALGAPHERDRVWIVAYANRDRQSVGAEHDETRGLPAFGTFAPSDASCLLGPAFFWQQSHRALQQHWPQSWADYAASLRGMDDGIPGRVDGLASLGNAVVPQIPEIIGRAILEAEGRSAGLTRLPIERGEARP